MLRLCERKTKQKRAITCNYVLFLFYAYAPVGKYKYM